MNNAEERVDRLLSDRRAVPWVEPAETLRARTLAALGATGRVSNPWRFRTSLAAAACLALAAGVFVINQSATAPPPPRPMEVRLDPAPLLGPALAQLTSSAEARLTMEARALLDDTKGFTRRVIAQLPFTGGG